MLAAQPKIDTQRVMCFSFLAFFLKKFRPHHTVRTGSNVSCAIVLEEMVKCYILSAVLEGADTHAVPRILLEHVAYTGSLSRNPVGRYFVPFYQ